MDYIGDKVYIGEEDSYAFIMSIKQPLLNLIFGNLSEAVEPILIASLRALEHVIEIIGCSIDAKNAATILKSIIETYP